jgi:hypothetical protein
VDGVAVECEAGLADFSYDNHRRVIKDAHRHGADFLSNAPKLHHDFSAAGVFRGLDMAGAAREEASAIRVADYTASPSRMWEKRCLEDFAAEILIVFRVSVFLRNKLSPNMATHTLVHCRRS